MSYVIPISYLERRIYMIRGHKVMLDSDLAALYGVSTKRLNEQVKRNLKRFPPDFMFQLKDKEAALLRSQIVTLERGPANLRSQSATSSYGGRRYQPYAFMRAFVRLRHMIATHKKLAMKLFSLEKKVGEHAQRIRSIFDAIYELTTTKKIGFRQT